MGSELHTLDSIRDSKHPIVFFDGVCNLCNSSVDFLIRRDSKKIFRYAPIQSKTAERLLGGTSVNLADPNSFVLFHKGEIMEQSTAVLSIVGQLGFPYSLLTVFKIIPRFLRNWVYRSIAQNRYKWFGKQDTCRLPTEKERDLFLD